METSTHVFAAYSQLDVSLVVAQATEDGPRIVSDMRVTLPHQQRASFRKDALKSVVVRRDVAVSFAGDLIAGITGIRQLASGLQRGQTIDDLLPELTGLASNDRRSVEFIVATDQLDSQLTRIRHDSIERRLQHAWIGDQEAFERFQKARLASVDPFWSQLQAELPPSTWVMMSLQGAMKAVIDDPAIESVDDFCVSVAHKQNGFEYLGSGFIYVERDITVQPGDDLISRMAQPVEEGGYAVSVVEPSEPGTPALGLSFPRARLGMVFLPLQFDEAQVVLNVSPNDFARVVYERFGVAMKDPGLVHPTDPTPQ